MQMEETEDQQTLARQQAIRSAQALVAKYTAGTERSLVDELLAEHRAEAARKQPWNLALAAERETEDLGEFDERRRRQARAWMWTLLEEGLRAAFLGQPGIEDQIKRLEGAVQALETTPGAAARALLERFHSD